MNIKKNNHHHKNKNNNNNNMYDPQPGTSLPNFCTSNYYLGRKAISEQKEKQKKQQLLERQNSHEELINGGSSLDDENVNFPFNGKKNDKKTLNLKKGGKNFMQIQKLQSLKMEFEKESKNKKRKPLIIGVSGGSASGKTTVCTKIVNQLKDSKRVVIISQDSFYNPLTEEEKITAKNSNFNFDHPNAFDYKLFADCIQKLKQGLPVSIPVYDFKTHSRTKEKTTILKADVIIIEGILIFYTEELRKQMDMKIYVETDDDLRLLRRIKRDMLERGRDLNSILTQYQKFVKPSFDAHISPTKRYADIIVPRGGDNIVAINLINQHIQSKLEEIDKRLNKELKKCL